MLHLNLSEADPSTQVVGESHFGANTIYRRNTENGVPLEDFVQAKKELDIKIVRYPAGEPDIAYANGMLNGDELTDHLENYLKSAREAGQKVVIVTPTHTGYYGPEELQSFAKILMYDFDDVVHAFEIGNEYWGHQTETEYGRIANDSVIAIDNALSELGKEVPIWVQMGDPGGLMSEFHISNNSSGWFWRTFEANNTIIDQLSTEARQSIDGVVEHYYFRETTQWLTKEISFDQNIGFDYELWQQALGIDISLNITEWNIRASNLEQLGIRAASTLVTQFSYLMQLEVDEAYVWPPQHNTSTDLAGGGQVIRDDETGIVINSVGGAAFDLMSSSLVGLEYYSTSVGALPIDIMHTLYASEDRAVVYLASRSNEVELVSYDLGDLFEGATLSSATKIGYDQSSSDGVHYDYRANDWADANYVLLDGNRYYINEHDVRAEITTFETDDLAKAPFEIALLPYEVVELTYVFNSFRSFDGTDAADRMEGTASEDIFKVGVGDDVVSSGSGNDTIHAGEGDDFVNSGSGYDLVYGDHGNDIVRTFGGADTVFGGDGNDDLSGGFGSDSLVGGSGNDSLEGGGGDDTLSGGTGADTLFGNDGNDLVDLGSNFGFSVDVGDGGRGNDMIFGGSGFDLLVGGENDDYLDGGDQADNLHGDLGNDTLVGGKGFDRLFGGEGNDLLQDFDGFGSLFGQRGDDTIQSGEESVNVFAGSGNDVIAAGGGNDNITGNAGFDAIIGGKGNDHLHGGFNADVFLFENGHGVDTIWDFDAHNMFEKIDLSDISSIIDIYDLNLSSETLGAATQIENDVLIETGNGNSILLIGVSITELDATDFVL